MSQIAQALAKAKERTGHTNAPFMTPGSAAARNASADSAAASAAAIRKARNTQRFWLILGCVCLPLTGFVLWSQLKKDAAPAPVPAATILPASVSAPSVDPTSAKTSAGGVAPSSVKPAVRPAATPTPASGQRPELISLVASLPVSAVMPGDPPRIMLAGRVVRAGQVAEGELTFSGIGDGQIRFTDAKGVVYTRYY